MSKEEVAIIVEFGDKCRLVICDKNCGEVLIDHDISNNPAEIDDLLQCFDVGDVLISALSSNHATLLQLEEEGYQVVSIDLAQPATRPNRFVNVATELLHEVNSDKGATLEGLLRINGKGQWRITNQAKKRLDVRTSIMMAYYRKYVSN